MASNQIRPTFRPALIKKFLAPIILLSAVVSAGALAEGTHQAASANKSSAGAGDNTAKKANVENRTLTEAEEKSAQNALKSLKLKSPIQGFDLQKIKGSFSEMRGGEEHHAADFVAPRNTPVVAVNDGKIAKLFLSKPGGITIYQFDPTEKFVFYYAHLEKYADGMTDGKSVKRGDVIGYVGTSGNAPPNTPHLHFSIGVMDKNKKWWEAVELDPYPILSAD